MLRTILLFCLVLSVQAQASSDFVGGASCVSCHGEQHELWQGSHHDLAMETPGAESVLGDFNGATFTHRDVTTTFFRKGDEWLIRTAGEDGKLADFPVRYTFGVYPLQQYLLPLSRGRLQAFEIAWDSRPKEEGGQRWFHLNPEEVTDHTDPLHWTGP
ncbi:MAG: cytochrome c family protein, partial [Haliea sp.]|nr:cytochrome c family protein [Haliea sp.]